MCAPSILLLTYNYLVRFFIERNQNSRKEKWKKKKKRFRFKRCEGRTPYSLVEPPPVTRPPLHGRLTALAVALRRPLQRPGAYATRGHQEPGRGQTAGPEPRRHSADAADATTRREARGLPYGLLQPAGPSRPRRGARGKDLVFVRRPDGEDGRLCLREDSPAVRTSAIPEEGEVSRVDDTGPR